MKEDTIYCMVCRQQTSRGRFCDQCGVDNNLIKQLFESTKDTLVLLGNDKRTPPIYLADYNRYEQEREELRLDGERRSRIPGSPAPAMAPPLSPLLEGIAYALCAEFIVELASKLIHLIRQKPREEADDQKKAEVETLREEVNHLEALIARGEYWLSQALNVGGASAKILTSAGPIPSSTRVDPTPLIVYLKSLGWSEIAAQSKAAEVVRLLSSAYGMDQPN